MNFDLDTFTELAENAEVESRSPLYRELDKAFLTLGELIIEKKITRKQIVGMLHKSGMTEEFVDETKFNAYWSSVGTKAKIDKYKADLEERELKKQQRHNEHRDADAILASKGTSVNAHVKTETIKDPVQEKPAPSPAPVYKGPSSHLRDSNKGSKKDNSRFANITSKPKVNKEPAKQQVLSGEVIPGDLLIPWKVFLTKAKDYAEMDSTQISNVLQEMGLVERSLDRKYMLKKTCEHFFPNAKAGQALTFSNLEVFGDTLLKGIQTFISKQ